MAKSINGGVTNINITYNSDLSTKYITVNPEMNQNDLSLSKGQISLILKLLLRAKMAVSILEASMGLPVFTPMNLAP